MLNKLVSLPVRAILLILPFAVLSGAIYADDEGLNCGQVYIDTGASKQEVKDACGEPLDRDKEDMHWTYQDSQDEDYRILVFGDDGTVIDIVTQQPDSVLDDIVTGPDQ